jgi:hypothetical protein
MRKIELTEGEFPVIRAALTAHRERLEAAIRRAKRSRDAEHADILTDELRQTNDIIGEINRREPGSPPLAFTR